jgi:hypothetical protein
MKNRITSETTLSVAQLAEYVVDYDRRITEELAAPAEDSAPEFVWMIDQQPAAKLERVAQLSRFRAEMMQKLQSKLSAPNH